MSIELFCWDMFCQYQGSDGSTWTTLLKELKYEVFSPNCVLSLSWCVSHVHVIGLVSACSVACACTVYTKLKITLCAETQSCLCKSTVIVLWPHIQMRNLVVHPVKSKPKFLFACTQTECLLVHAHIKPKLNLGLGTHDNWNAIWLLKLRLVCQRLPTCMVIYVWVGLL